MILCIQDDAFKIQNNLLNSRDELLQAVHFLLRTDSPYATLATSLSGLIGDDLESVKSDIRVRVKNMESLLRNDYGVKSVLVQDVVQNDTQFDIDLLFFMVDGSARQETVTYA